MQALMCVDAFNATLPLRVARCAAGRLKEPAAFSVGPRDCVGQALARLELMVVLAATLARFVPHLDEAINTFQDLAKQHHYHVTLMYVGGVWIKFEPR
eukprot:357027-Chlamydomonas_euryale.AAC.4